MTRLKFGLRFLQNEHYLSSIGWLVFMSVLCINCMVHSLFIIKEPINLIASIIWPIKQWGIWVLITPFILHMLKSRHKLPLSSVAFYLLLSSATLSLSLTFVVAIEVSGGEISLAHSLFSHWSNHTVTFIIIVLLWHLKDLFSLTSSSVKSSQEPTQVRTTTHAQALSIEVEDCEQLIPFSEILFIRAAGNYMEVITTNKSHLTRSTLKQLHDTLPQDMFVKCHRSYLVNITHISKLKNHAPGHASAQLSNNDVIPVSKSQRRTIRTLLTRP